MADNILFYRLTNTNKYLFQGLPTDAHQVLNTGKRSEIPAHIQESTEPIDRILIDAIQMSWVQDSNEIVTARAIVDHRKTFGLYCKSGRRGCCES